MSRHSEQQHYQISEWVKICEHLEDRHRKELREIRRVCGALLIMVIMMILLLAVMA